MSKIRKFFNSGWFIGLAAFAAFVALMFGFITPNQQREEFLQSRTATAMGLAAAAIFIIYLLMLPRGAIKRFVNSEGFVGLIAIVLTGFLTYLFIVA